MSKLRCFVQGNLRLSLLACTKKVYSQLKQQHWDRVAAAMMRSESSDEELESSIIPETPVCHSYKEEIFAQIQLAIPVCCTFVMRKSVDMISVMFVGHLGRHYLSAAGIASVTANVTGNSMVFGLAGALSTICSQAFGSKDMATFNAAPQKAVLILFTFICMPISLLWWYSAPVMIALGQVIIFPSCHYIKLSFLLTV